MWDGGVNSHLNLSFRLIFHIEYETRCFLMQNLPILIKNMFDKIVYLKFNNGDDVSDY